MNILLLHNRYQKRGGEDVVVEAETRLLASSGHTVRTEIVSNDQVVGPLAKFEAAARAAYDSRRAEWVRQLVLAHDIQIVHIHNFFPILTPAVHEGAARAGAAVVQTLHNYRLICSGAHLLRNGLECEKCVTGSKLWGVAHRCYRGSLPGSAAIALMQERAERRRTWHRYVHRFIALTAQNKTKFVSAGLPGDRISIKPNFVFAPMTGHFARREEVLFVGRLAREKGVHLILEAARAYPAITFRIIGDGPEAQRLRSAAPGNVSFLGQKNQDEVRIAMQTARMLLVPSIWPETFGITVVEAFAAALPVVASRIGALAELVENEVTGLHFETGNVGSLVVAIGRLLSSPEATERMGLRAQKTYEELYSPARNAVLLERIYQEAQAQAKE